MPEFEIAGDQPIVELNEGQIVKAVKYLDSSKQKTSDGTMDVAAQFKALKDKGLNTEALRLVMKLRKLDAAKASDFIEQLCWLAEVLGLNKQLELFREDGVRSTVGTEAPAPLH